MLRLWSSTHKPPIHVVIITPLMAAGHVRLTAVKGLGQEGETGRHPCPPQQHRDNLDGQTQPPAPGGCPTIQAEGSLGYFTLTDSEGLGITLWPEP